MSKVKINDKITVQTVIIAILITGIVAFVGGSIYQKNVSTEAHNQVTSAVSEVQLKSE